MRGEWHSMLLPRKNAASLMRILNLALMASSSTSASADPSSEEMPSST